MMVTATMLWRTLDTRTPLTVLVEHAILRPTLKLYCQLILDEYRLCVRCLNDCGAIYDESIESNSELSSDSAGITNNYFTLNLTDCVCYTDCRYDDVLILVGGAVYIFRFANSNILGTFCANFHALKICVNAQRVGRHRFDLVRKTTDGVTHVEVVAPSTRSWTSVDNLSKSSPVGTLTAKRRFDFVEPRSRSEQRNGNQMLVAPSYDKRSMLMGHRFFGLSPKLCNFTESQPIKSSFREDRERCRRKKRVTFSAYATVQMVF